MLGVVHQPVKVQPVTVRTVLPHPLHEAAVPLVKVGEHVFEAPFKALRGVLLIVIGDREEELIILIIRLLLETQLADVLVASHPAPLRIDEILRRFLGRKEGRHLPQDGLLSLVRLAAGVLLIQLVKQLSPRRQKGVPIARFEALIVPLRRLLLPFGNFFGARLRTAKSPFRKLIFAVLLGDADGLLGAITLARGVGRMGRCDVDAALPSHLAFGIPLRDAALIELSDAVSLIS